MNKGPRVVITGMGAISPVGLNCRDTFDNLVAGFSGIDRITRFDPSRLASQIAGEVRNFDPHNYMDKKTARRIGRYAQFSIAAAREAIDQAELDVENEDPTRIACLVSSAIGDFPTVQDQMEIFFRRGPGKTNPFTVPRASTSMAAGNISLEFGLRGPGFGVSSACATGSHSLLNAWMVLKSGFADVAFAGGAESAICETFFDSYIAMRALSTRNDDPRGSSRPFDKDRDGFVIGEGCAVLILESFEHAQQRQAKILAELIGVGMTCDAYHITAPHPDGRDGARAIAMALHSAGVKSEDIDYINAHGTATPMNDPVETNAIKTIFGQYAYDVPISSIKSMIGHTIGAAGALEAVSCVMAINESTIPPTINLDNPDPKCDLDYVPHKARKKDLRVVMSNSFAFGGQNCVLLFRRFESH